MGVVLMDSVVHQKAIQAPNWDEAVVVARYKGHRASSMEPRFWFYTQCLGQSMLRMGVLYSMGLCRLLSLLDQAIRVGGRRTNMEGTPEKTGAPMRRNFDSRALAMCGNVKLSLL